MQNIYKRKKGGKSMCPPTFIKDDVNNEKELHDLIEKEIEALEPEIRILKHEFQCGEPRTVSRDPRC